MPETDQRPALDRSSVARPVLARIVAAHRGRGEGRPDPAPDLQAALSRAVRRAAMPFDGLLARPGAVTVACATTLSDSVEDLPPTGLVAALEDAEGRRGLVALGHQLVDALIEVQTTGRVDTADLPARPVTRIDESLCRDFLDLLLAAFARETSGAAWRDWPERVTYGSRIPDRAQLNLLLPERLYHRLTVDVAVGAARRGRLVLLVPSDPALARRQGGAAAGGATGAGAASAATRPGDWAERVMAALAPAQIPLDAVLFRATLPLGRVEALVPGDLLPFDRSDLSAVTLEGEGGHVYLRGALGQIGGRRALRPVAAAPRQAGLAGGTAPGAAPEPAAYGGIGGLPGGGLPGGASGPISGAAGAGAGAGFGGVPAFGAGGEGLGDGLGGDWPGLPAGLPALGDPTGADRIAEPPRPDRLPALRA